MICIYCITYMVHHLIHVLQRWSEARLTQSLSMCCDETSRLSGTATQWLSDEKGGPTAPLNGNWMSFTQNEDFFAKLAYQPAPFPIPYHSAPITAWSASGWWRPIRYLVLKVITHRSGWEISGPLTGLLQTVSNTLPRPYLQPGKPISEARSLVDFFIKGFRLGSPWHVFFSRKPHKNMFHANKPFTCVLSDLSDLSGWFSKPWEFCDCWGSSSQVGSENWSHLLPVIPRAPDNKNGGFNGFNPNFTISATMWCPNN